MIEGTKREVVEQGQTVVFLLLSRPDCLSPTRYFSLSFRRERGEEKVVDEETTGSRSVFLFNGKLRYYKNRSCVYS